MDEEVDSQRLKLQRPPAARRAADTKAKRRRACILSFNHLRLTHGIRFATLKAHLLGHAAALSNQFGVENSSNRTETGSAKLNNPTAKV